MSAAVSYRVPPAMRVTVAGSTACAGAGHDVIVLDEDAEDESLVAVRSGSVRDVPFPSASRPWNLYHPLRGWGRRRAVAAAADEWRADVVHVTYLDLTPRWHNTVVT